MTYQGTGTYPVVRWVNEKKTIFETSVPCPKCGSFERVVHINHGSKDKGPDCRQCERNRARLRLWVKNASGARRHIRPGALNEFLAQGWVVEGTVPVNVVQAVVQAVDVNAVWSQCFPKPMRVGKGERQETSSPTPSGLPRQEKTKKQMAEALVKNDFKCAACRNPFGLEYAIFRWETERGFEQIRPQHSHFWMTREQGKRMGVATDGFDHPMCKVCDKLLGNNKSDQWASLQEFGEYSHSVQIERQYKVRKLRIDGESFIFEPIEPVGSTPGSSSPAAPVTPSSNFAAEMREAYGVTTTLQEANQQARNK